MRRLLGRIAAITLVAAAVWPASAAAPAVAAAAPPPPAPVSLTGAGSGGISAEMLAWASTVSASPAPIDLSYLAQGDRDGRQAFIRGDADFAVSGLGFTKDEQDQLAQAKRSFVAIPIQPDALLLMLRPPLDGLSIVTGTADAPEFIPYSGPIPMPGITAARAMLELANTWNDADFKAALGVDLRPYIHAISPVVASEPGATDYFLAAYLASAAPDVWAQALANASVKSTATSESWPIVSLQTRAGVPAIVNAVASDYTPESGGATQGGNIGPVPLWAFADAKARLPRYDLRAISLKNAAGEWVLPTTQTVAAAITAGKGQPLSALGQPEPGAYPLSWVNYLYAPAGGMPPDKTNALATLVRFAATTGRAVAASTGDAPLPGFLAAQALDGANQIVRTNCTQDGYMVTATTDPGPYAPSPGALAGAGSMLSCAPKVATVPTSTSQPVTSTVPGPVLPPTPTVIPKGSLSTASASSALAHPATSPAAPVLEAPATSSVVPSQEPVPTTSLAGILSLPPFAVAMPVLPKTLAVLPAYLTSDPGSAPGQHARATRLAAEPALPFSLPSGAFGRGDRPVTLLLGALAYWQAAAAVRRRRRPI